MEVQTWWGYTSMVEQESVGAVTSGMGSREQGKRGEVNGVVFWARLYKGELSCCLTH